MKIFLSAALLLTTIIANGQALSGKMVYSHHNRFANTKADSIYSVTQRGVRKFITLGFDPKVSPSGTYMAFENGPSYDALRANVWMRNLSTHKDTQIISNPNDYLNYFDFYSSGQQIVYAQSCDIYTSNINGSNAYTFLVCTPCDCYSDDPQIRYSDNLIVYHNQHYGIYTCNSNGSNPQKMNNTIPGDMYPTWSPDGKWITYLKTSLNNNVYKLNVTTGDTTRLTFLSKTDTAILNPCWSRDMKTVYFIARIKGRLGIYKVSASGNGKRSLVYAFGKDGSVYDYFLGRSNTTNIVAPVANSNAGNVSGAAAKNKSNTLIQVYPNPSNGSFRIITKELNKAAEVTINDPSGKTVYQNIFYNTSSAYIQLNGAKGIYFLTFKTDSGTTIQKLIIQ